MASKKAGGARAELANSTRHKGISYAIDMDTTNPTGLMNILKEIHTSVIAQHDFKGDSKFLITLLVLNEEDIEDQVKRSVGVATGKRDVSLDGVFDNGRKDTLGKIFATELPNNAKKEADRAKKVIKDKIGLPVVKGKYEYCTVQGVTYKRKAGSRKCDVLKENKKPIENYTNNGVCEYCTIRGVRYKRMFGSCNWVKDVDEPKKKVKKK